MADGKVTDRLVADRYRLLEQVGRGGMGVVWRAHDEVLGRDVAVKEVHLQAGLTDDERDAVQQRVMREARAAASLNHPGAVTVFDVVDHGDQAFIVMELISSPTLHDVVTGDGPLTVVDAARLGISIVDVLAAAHAVGIVHRDLKPANVLVTASGSKLTDFGIATIKDDPRLTSTGIVLGSPAYIAPEQARGHEVTPATDLWGLGATLHYAVCGRSPFDRGEAIATLTAVAHDDADVDPSAGALTPVLAALLAKEPSGRPSLVDVRASLSAVAQGETPTRAAPRPTAVLPAGATSATTATTAALPAAAAPRDVVRVPATAARRAFPVVPVLLAALAALLLVVLVVDRAGDDGRGEPVGGVLERSASAAPSGAPEQPSSRPSAPTSAEPAVEASLPVVGDLPGEFSNDAAGYTVRYPDGWERVGRSGNAIDFREDGTGRYLRVDWTDSPGDDPVADWRRQSAAFGSSHDGYEEIRIEPVEFRGLDAAVWEYRYVVDGVTLRATNLAIVTDDRGYALNFQTREPDWADSQDLRRELEDAFQIRDAES